MISFLLLSQKFNFKMELKIRYELEIPITSSASLLWPYISTPSGLSEWFADNVNSRGEFYTFIWDDSEEMARVSSKKSFEKIKFRWVDEQSKDTDYYFEIRILEDEITKDVSLMIVDFAIEDEIEESQKLWESQVAELKHVIGSI